MKRYLILLTLGLATVMSIACAAKPAPAATQPAATKPEPVMVKPVIKAINAEAESALSSQTTLSTFDNAAQSGPLTYAWTAEKGTIKGEGSKVTWMTPDTPGQYKITVTATNKNGDQATFDRTLVVSANPYGRNVQDTTLYIKPSAQNFQMSSRIQAMTMADIQCTMDGSDPKDLTYTWKVTGGKLSGDGIQEGTASRVGWLAPGMSGTFTVSVVAQDKNGHKATGQIDFDVYLMQ